MNGLLSSLVLILTVALNFVGPSVAGAQPASQPATHFVHPGLLNTQAELDVIRARLAAGDPNDPTVAGFNSTMATKFANVDYEPTVVARPRRRDRPAPDSCVLERDSAMIAYTLALKWAVAGDVAARDKSIEIMNAWAAAFEGRDGDVNTYLDSAWVITVWCNAAELIRHAKVDGQTAPWPDEQVETFKGMIRKLNSYSSQIITKPFNPVSNWGMSAMTGDMAAGVFLDDRAIFERGRDAMLKYMPGALLKGGWTNEVDRDPWHGLVSVSGVCQGAEIARHQNDLSIYHATYDGQAEPRLLVALKWFADPLRGKPSPVPAMRSKKTDWTFVCTPNTARSTGGYEMALNFYQHIEHRPGLEEVQDMVLTTYRPSGQDNSIFIGSDTLTHAELYNSRLKHHVKK